MTTMAWLRRVVYDRVPAKHGVMAVFVASAVWHGFYPGYYIMFISAAFFTHAARLVRLPSNITIIIIIIGKHNLTLEHRIL